MFRDQNRVADELAFALGPEGPAALEIAEQELLRACAGVNELATARRDDRRLPLRRRLDAAREAPVCESATRAARQALRENRDEP